MKFGERILSSIYTKQGMPEEVSVEFILYEKGLYEKGNNGIPQIGIAVIKRDSDVVKLTLDNTGIDFNMFNCDKIKIDKSKEYHCHLSRFPLLGRKKEFEILERDKVYIVITAIEPSHYWKVDKIDRTITCEIKPVSNLLK